jgi:hypothetical protein
MSDPRIANPATIVTASVPVCATCRRLLDRCLADPCYLKVVDAEFTIVRPELPAPPEERTDA